MSDVGITMPAWAVVLLLSIEFWPAIAGLAAASIAAAFFLPRLWRGAAIGLAVLLLLDLALVRVAGFKQRRQEASAQAYDQTINTTLPADLLVDGLTLPAGTAISWADPAHTHLTEAVLPHSAPVLGLAADRVRRSVDGGWALQLAGPQAVDGWTCQPDLVELTQGGHLARCELALAREWNGWPIPAKTLVTLTDQSVGLVFPTDAPVMAPEIGRPLPATGGMTLNADGSLDSVYFEADAPFAVCGGTIWNTVNWRYDPSTFGQGRARQPASVTGASPAGDDIEDKLPACTK